MAHLKENLPRTLDPYQFAYRRNRSTEDGVSTALHTVSTHLDSSNSYVQILFVGLQLSIQHCYPLQVNHKTWRSGHQHLPLQLDTGLSDLSILGQAKPAPPPLPSKPMYRRALYFAHSSTPSSIMTPSPCMAQTLSYGNCSITHHKALQRVGKTAQDMTRTPLPAVKDVQRKRCQ